MTPSRIAYAEPQELPYRSIAEWVGKTADSKVPRAVKARVFARYEGRCYLTGRKIRPGEAWDVEHIKPIRSARPGEPHLNCESNLAPALKEAHREKTAAENSAGAKADRIHAKHFGYHPKSRAKIPSRKFSPSRPSPSVSGRGE